MAIEVILQSGHTAPIVRVAFAPDETVAATCSSDETVRLWDLAAGCESGVLQGHVGAISRVVFSADGRWLASGGWDRTVHLWSAREHRSVRQFEHVFETIVDGIAFDPTSTFVAAAGGHGKSQLRVWHRETGNLLRDLRLTQVSSAVAFSPDGSRVAVAGTDGTCGIVSLATGEYRRVRHIDRDSFSETLQPLYSDVCFTSDGTWLAALLRGRVCLFEAVTGAYRGDLCADATARALVPLQDGALAVLASDVRVWMPSTSREVARIGVRADAISATGRLLGRVDANHLELVDARTTSRVRRFGDAREMPYMGNLAKAFVLAVDPSHPRIATASPDDHVRIWDLRRAARPELVASGRKRVTDLRYNSTGDVLAIAGSAGVTLWDAVHSCQIAEFDVEGAVAAVAFSPDDTRLLLACDTTEGQLARVVEIATGRVLATTPIAFHPNSVLWPPWNQLMIGAFGGLKLWRLDTNEMEEGPQNVGALAASSRGAIAIGTSIPKLLLQPGIIALWVSLDGPSISIDAHRQGVQALSFSADGGSLVSGSADGTIACWAVSTSRRMFSQRAHAGEVKSVAFTPDGQLVATIGLDAALRLWDSTTGALVATLVALEGDDYVVVTANGHYAASKPGLRAIMFRIDGRMYPFEQLDLRLNRPDRVLESLGYADATLLDEYALAHERRARRLGLAGAIELTAIESPGVELIRTGLPVMAETRTLAFTVHIRTATYPLSQLQVLVNDVPVFGRSGLAVRTPSEPTEVSIELATGDNKVQVCAIDTNLIESPRETFRVFYPGDGTCARLFVLAIGVSRYRDERHDLRYAAKDARDLVDTIAGIQTRFSRVENLILADADATLSAIAGARAFLAQTNVDDQVVVLFAGHGVVRSGDYYFLPHDFDSLAVEETAVSYELIESLVDGIRARRRLVLLDTCHAGEGIAGAVPPSGGERAILRDVRPTEASDGRRELELDRLSEVFADLRRDSGAYVIAAAGAAEYARENDTLQNGVFTHAVIELLRARPKVTVSELHRLVADAVTSLTGGRQRPVSRRENLEDDFAVV